MKIKRLLVLMIIIAFISTFNIFVSHSYLTTIISGTGNNNKLTTKSDFNISFNTTDNISMTDSPLILDTKRKNYDNITKFDIELSDTTISSAKFSIYLNELTLTNNYLSKYVKWELVPISNGVEQTAIASGNFANCNTCSGGKLVLKSDLTISKGSTLSYGVRIWLSEDSSANTLTNNQNSLMNGSLSAKVGIEAQFTKN